MEDHSTTWNVFDARNASTKSRDAGDPSRSWTTIGIPVTVIDIAVPRSINSATGSTSVTPTLSWTYPSGASSANYIYSFYLSDTIGNTVWSVPSQQSNFSGFTYAQDTTGTLVWGTDPIPGDNSTPTGNLNTSTQYTWQIQVQDSNGNQAQAQTWYKP